MLELTRCIMRKACISALAPLASGCLSTLASGGERTTVTSAPRVSCREYVTHNSSRDQRRRRRGGRPQEQQQRGHSASAPGSVSRVATGAASTAVSPSPHARDAFNVFLRSRNAPFVCGGTAAASQPAGDLSSTTSPLHPPQGYLYSNAQALGGAQSTGAPAETVSRAKGAATRNTSSDDTARHSLSSATPPPFQRRPDGATAAKTLKEPRSGQRIPLEEEEEEEASRRGASAPPVLGEWSLDPPKASTRKTDAQGGRRSGEHQEKGYRHHGDMDGDANANSPHRGRLLDPCERRRRSASQRRHDALELARRHTSAQISNRHQREYEQTCVQAYVILTRVEWGLIAWARAQRQGQGPDASGRSCTTRSGSAGDPGSNVQAPQPMEGEGAADECRIRPASEDMDAVDARFFEYAGQIQRTLHQLTPRHFDAVCDYRLRAQPRSGSPSTAPTPPSRPRCAADSTSSRSKSLGDAPPPPQQPLLLLRLLWRLLHIKQLFLSIGRRASLPRTAVDVYVKSSNCQYGTREVLRVLGREIGRSAALASPHLHLRNTSGQQSREHDGCASSPSAPLAPLFCNKTLFQLFYAILCIPSEEAPGVPLYDPPVNSCTPRHGGGSERNAATSTSTDLPDAATEQFWRDCITTGPKTACMPLDEWCVRWWSHQYSVGGGADATWVPPLSMGEAMDVLKACMYAMTSVQVPATAAPRHTAQRRRHPQQSLTSPFLYFETQPQGATDGFRRRRTDSACATTSEGKGTVEEAEPSPLRVPHRRYRPQLSGALGGNRMALRIPYHLGQRYVEVLLTYLLSRVSAGQEPGEAKQESTETVAAGIAHLLRFRDRDTVRDIALLCTAILFFEVFSPMTAAFMAYAAPLFREQVELLSGHEISCVLLAYASLQRWERAGGARSGGISTSACGPNANAEPRAAGRRGDPLYDPTVAVQSASTASATTAAAPGSSAYGDAWDRDAPREAAEPERSQQRHADDEGIDDPQSRRRQSHATRSSSSRAHMSTGPQSTSHESWHLFYVTLASRAGQLSDTLSEDDVTRVLRAIELTGIEHDDLRHALASSLRMRNMGRRILYTT
ncbi:hypothetical protein, conserved [Leishmania tarentolae]|uniref:Uncharacterized protein n=1 Tax=Leishmania tarentolae TaxID=5689 RepID=A0A640K837_LEITA|nr:hypothetical protein, conserved [Leishmania tarentolae]